MVGGKKGGERRKVATRKLMSSIMIKETKRNEIYGNGKKKEEQ